MHSAANGGFEPDAVFANGPSRYQLATAMYQASTKPPRCGSGAEISVDRHWHWVANSDLCSYAAPC